LGDFVEPELFEQLAETAARALGVPCASLSIFDGDAVTVRAAYGFERADANAGADGAFRALARKTRAPFAVANAAEDERFGEALAAFGPVDARACAGAPIVVAGATCYGLLCAYDRRARRFARGHLETLRSIAALAAHQIEAHAALVEADAVRSELATLVDASPLAISTMDAAGRVRTWSAAAERISGYTAAEAVGKHPPWVPGGRAKRDVRELLATVRRGASYVNHHLKCIRADGTPVDMFLAAAPMFAADGAFAGFVALCGDVAERERTEHRLHQFESVVTRTSDAVYVTAAQPPEDPEILWVNDAFVKMFGREASGTIGARVSALRAIDFDPAAGAEFERARRERAHAHGTMWYRRPDGTTFLAESSLSPVIEADGSCNFWVVIARDVTERRRADRLQQDRGEMLELIATAAPMERILKALVETAERARPNSGAVVRVRQGDELSRAAYGQTLASVFAGLEATVTVGDPIEPCGRSAESGEQVVVVAADEDPRPDAIRAVWSSPIMGGEGQVVGTFALYATAGVPPSVADLALGREFAYLAGLAMERDADRARLEFLALHDPLTALPNRKLFQMRLDAAIAGARSGGRHVAIGMIDLDRFKMVNDSLGHAVGDQLLRDVATRLARSVRPGDTVARLGGDEFVLLMDDLPSRDAALEITERVLQALGPSFDCDGHEVFVRASVGLSTYPGDASDTSSLMALGDAAMYEAKSAGRGVSFHVPADRHQGIARIALETSLNHALERHELDIVFQPQVELRSREIRGAEALLRWNHPTLGRLLPDDFMGAAEDTGLIVPMGAWVLKEACRFARRWQDEGSERFVSVNISARQFDRAEFVEAVTKSLGEAGLEPHRLHLELTESLVMRSPEKAVTTLGALKELGVKIAIDDFGTGYSSFNYLKRFPLDTLKIDRTFVRDIGYGNRAPHDEAIVRAIVGVARALDLGIVAEGVETEDQLAFLRAIGVPYAQGLLFAPGLPPDAANVWTKATVRA
jgi:diguanylate cyclase (GGDEF)-like protein/PAS domain S-box-containing protein